ncbi:MAG: transketolase C-terminal domain-containing protein, partial [Bacillota bacterium]|nr:transketolase C-terminal domain-containing protein [Bacillota bacterium]
HDIKWLVKMLYRAKKVDKCVLFHVKTVKGKGYAPAEKQPQMYHGVSKFNYRLRKIDNNKRDYSTVFGEELIKIAEKNKRVVAVTAAMPSGTGLIEFAEKFPKRFFDVGIAEQHAVTTAAGMAINGLIPVVPIYSTFMQRGFDSILHDVCFQNLHVVLCGDRAGIVGEDGETHQGVFDLSFMRMMPNMTILAPADFNQLKAMLKYAVNRHNSPIFIRYPRGGEDADVSKSARNFECGKAEIIKEGKDVCIIAAGRMTAKSIKTAEILESRGISTKVIDVRTVKPLDRETILNALKGISLAVTVEDNIIDGGMGEELLRIINDSKEKTDFLIKAYECGQIEHGKADELMKLCKMDSESIADEITARIRR